jgi:hypothetical protein
MMKGVIKSSELIILNVTTTIALIRDAVYVFDVAKRLNYTNHG